MNTTANTYWPRHLPREVVAPDITLWDSLVLSAKRYGSRPAIHSFGRELTYSELVDESTRFAGWLVQSAGVRPGDRVLICMQNSAQWVIAYHGVIRADAIVVPVNPMNKVGELNHYLNDSGAVIAVCAQDTLAEMQQATENTEVREIVVATYSDYISQASEDPLPAWLRAKREMAGRHVAWSDVMAARQEPPLATATPDDLCALPYTSGSTGVAKACMHTHRSLMHNTCGLALWHGCAPASAFLCVTPMYHVAGLAHSLNLPIHVGGTLVILPRWDRELALRLLSRQRIAHAAILPTAVIDLLAHPSLADYDLSGWRRVTAGGASMPLEVWNKLRETLGLDFIEGYGMTETAATTHNNPIDRPKRQCLGVPFFNTESLIVDPQTLSPMEPGQAGEILVRGPQLFRGYWRRPNETAAAFVDVAGKRWLRTGDIGHRDDEGYFYITDRAKRMINASGFKVWPAEVELVLYQHPGIKEVCVIGTHDSYRGETVKAVVTTHAHATGLTEQQVIDWARERMAAYKYPRIVEFTTQLPKSPLGKILWRELQDAEDKKSKETT